jgi:hypothetical protein
MTPRPSDDGGYVVPAKVVSRVKISPTLIFDLLRTINHNMGRYEGAFGEIKHVGGPPEDPDV